MKVLVVDDDMVSRLALRNVIQRFGPFETVEVEDGAAALALLRAGLQPVLCCCDVRMPNMSGVELLQQVRAMASLAAMPFVLVSAASDQETLQQAVDLGATGYLLKPIEAEAARQLLGKVLTPWRERIAEHPAATLKRLQLSPERLLTYFAAFQRQISSAEADLPAWIASGDDRSAQQRVQALHAGCLTLGLWQAASTLEAQALASQTAHSLQQVLQHLFATVSFQADQINALLPDA